MARSYAETMGLEYEAERLVRMGESRAEVSRRLGVHPQTLAGWALRGGWRKKDLEMERNKEITRATILAIRRGNRAVDAEQALRARMVDFMREAVRLLAEGDDGALGGAGAAAGGGGEFPPAGGAEGGGGARSEGGGAQEPGGGGSARVKVAE